MSCGQGCDMHPNAPTSSAHNASMKARAVVCGGCEGRVCRAGRVVEQVARLATDISAADALGSLRVSLVIPHPGIVHGAGDGGPADHGGLWTSGAMSTGSPRGLVAPVLVAVRCPKKTDPDSPRRVTAPPSRRRSRPRPVARALGRVQACPLDGWRGCVAGRRERSTTGSDRGQVRSRVGAWRWWCRLAGGAASAAGGCELRSVGCGMGWPSGSADAWAPCDPGVVLPERPRGLLSCRRLGLPVLMAHSANVSNPYWGGSA